MEQVQKYKLKINHREVNILIDALYRYVDIGTCRFYMIRHFPGMEKIKKEPDVLQALFKSIELNTGETRREYERGAELRNLISNRWGKDLIFSLEECQIIMRALEFYSRIGMGQFIVIREMPGIKIDYTSMRVIANDLKEEIGLAPSQSWGISNRKISDSYRVAWDIHQVIRHRLSWDLDPDGGYQVYFDKPFRTSHKQMTLCEIEKV